MKKVLLLFVLAFISLQLDAQIIITGLMSDPKGMDQPKVGSTSKCSGNIVTHQGGYEYMQFMATQDIDFSVTPYSVVVANNGNATAEGWATGGGGSGATTFKFNLTSGTALKGTYFYVGSASKVIASYDACVTPSLSTGTGANWIRTISVYGNAGEVVGDGFGHSTTNLLGNRAGASLNGAADGIAVFTGTNVTSSSVPIDAIFWGDGIAGAYRESGGAFVGGYQVPDNDLYTRSGGETPYFGQTGNTFIFPQAGVDLNEFLALGGVYDLDNQEWSVARSGTLIPLNTLSTLVDIESETATQVLPVELAYFEAKEKNNAIELKWKTESENNNNYFSIAKSSDGITYTDIGKVRSLGNANEAQEYRYLDSEPFLGVTYYSLAQVDFDGVKKKLGVSAVRTASIDLETSFVALSEKNVLKVQYYNNKYPESGTIDIYSIGGQKLESIKVNFTEGNNFIEIPFYYPSGLYVVVLATSSGYAVREKIINE